MHGDGSYLASLDMAVPPGTPEDQAKLLTVYSMNYNQCIGELLWAIITCHPDLSFAVTKLCQFATNPAAEHYEAVQRVYRYLNLNPTDGITYWRRRSNPILPDTPAPLPKSHLSDLPPIPFPSPTDPGVVAGYVDSDWASDMRHRRSISGIAYLLAGGVIAYKTRVQPVISTSSTEAEFVAACDAGKIALYLRSILAELGIPQTQATVLYEDNVGAQLMANAGQPTKRTRHMDIKFFALQDWVEHDLLVLERIDTSVNCSDALTKPNNRILFNRHLDRLMGRVAPSYSPTSPL
jgi:hypothetical protein